MFTLLKKRGDTMKVVSNIEIGKKLRAIRKKAGLSQRGLAKIELKKNGFSEEQLETSSILNSEESTISQIERGARSLTIDKAVTFAEIFNVSLDYFFRETESYKSEYEFIKEKFGFSDDALNKLEQLNKDNKEMTGVLNKLLSVDLLPFFVELLEAFSEHSYIGTKSLVSLYPGNTFLTSQNIKGYYKKPIILKPKDLEYQSLFKISEISKNIANELKKNGGK